ncbi:MAG: hypothetical protein KGR48_04760 [Alphaproteobacteria bacterium]|nr:hypothetical protein [Alphaproteobacteria bacterium]MDE2353317.1 hypothetical protein [Alphaproteobacteria bacterium]
MKNTMPMTCSLRSLLLATVLAVSPVAIGLVAPQPALAQIYAVDDQPVDFDFFYDQLAPYGNWFQSDRWGYVWQPEDVGPDFRPYYDGHWVYTARYGWYWVSDEDWGDIVYHYGRWVFDPDDGWLWLPGYVWGPGWVIWREGDGVTGWFPMPPDDSFFDNDEPYRGDWGDYADDDYGYRDWYGSGFSPTFFSLWTFVDNDHFGERHFHRYVRREDDDRDFFRHTHDDTHYATDHNYVVNRGIDPDRLPRPVHPVSLDDVLHHHAMRPTPIDLGQDVRRRERQRHPQLMPQWFQQNPAHAHIPAHGDITGTRAPRREGNWPRAASRGQQRPTWMPQRGERFRKPASPGAARPFDRVTPGHETMPPAAVQPRGPNNPNWGYRDWIGKARPVPHHDQVPASDNGRAGLQSGEPDHRPPQDQGAGGTWQQFERVQRPTTPPHVGAPAQSFSHVQTRPFSPPPQATAPQIRSVPESATSQHPAEGPQRRDEPPRDHDRRERPQ